jgi:uncharacterized protein with von Willebrand factor type A (vWA) domain
MLQPSATSPEITHSHHHFMIANDPYLKFVNKFTESNQGKLLYGLKRLGEMIFEDYETNRKRRIK